MDATGLEVTKAWPYPRVRSTLEATHGFVTKESSMGVGKGVLGLAGGASTARADPRNVCGLATRASPDEDPISSDAVIDTESQPASLS